MPHLRRRRLLRTLGAVGAAGAVAGCVDGTPLGGGEGDDRLREDGVVDYPAMVDGAASVGADERQIRYEDPEATFDIDAGYEGEPADESELRVSRDLPGDTMAGFVAPVAVDGEFEFHVFANEAFVEFADWYLVVAPPGSEPEGRGAAGFEHLADDVYGTVADPVDGNVLLVVDAPADEIARDGTGLSGIGIQRESRDAVRRTAPNVAFGFDYDAEAERLEVTHDGGDGVARDELRFDADEDVTVLEDFEEETVRAGHRATLSVPPSATVRVVWESSDDDRSATLASWSGPDA